MTSQKCSDCGAIVKKSLSTRSHVCNCGCSLHRDVNAAKNILNLAKARVGHTRCNASEVETTTLIGVSLTRASFDCEGRIPRLSDKRERSDT